MGLRFAPALVLVLCAAAYGRWGSAGSKVRVEVVVPARAAIAATRNVPRPPPQTDADDDSDLGSRNDAPLRTHLLGGELDVMRFQRVAGQERQFRVILVTLGVGLVAAVGHVFWARRGSYRSVARLLDAPVWRQFDLLNVLDNPPNASKARRSRRGGGRGKGRAPASVSASKTASREGLDS